MLAKGAEARGQGTAQATLNMAVTEREGGSHVSVSADMLVTGRVAQMGRGVMQDVARRMIGQMAQNMEALLTGGEQPQVDAVSAGSLLGSVVADRAKRIFGSGGSRPLAALAGYALLSLALFGRGVLRDGGGSVVGCTGRIRRRSPGRWRGGRTRSSTASTRC